MTASLTMTVAGGVNDGQFPQVLDFFFSRPHLASLMIQPLALAGRGRNLAVVASRLTIPDVVQRLGRAGIAWVSAEDFVPLPCSHPLCFSLAFYLMLDGGKAVSLNRLLDASTWLDAIANRTIFGLDEEEHDRMKDMIYDLWSGPAGAVPESEAVMKTLRGLLDEMACGCFEPRRAFALSQRRVKSIFIHAFQDADSFDLARVRRCCNGYPQPDGSVVPACVHNVLGRDGQRRTFA
jgi:7,8-dihydro-6-hydroxymethylpterin dimethyltransferase